ncbi:methyltransferase [Nocardiopsis sp. MG754419]|uniref:methyltransferase n=1 Tax=Nocardiopsis sp. MG754419 TaxID=2259865 RepID=UPI001BAC798A|nr:methyltransferase [Nocardiopsis sp. MG754419]MBR8743065.1 methyltransferase [Nocardiopsis sp. MG754419]
MHPSLLDRLPPPLPADRIVALNRPKVDLHTHRSYAWNGWDFEVPPGVFLPGATSRMIHQRVLDDDIDVRGRSYAAVGVGLGVEAVVAGVRGAARVHALDVVTFNPPAVSRPVSQDPDIVRNVCAGTPVTDAFFDQLAERDLLAPGGEVFLIASNTADLRHIIGHALTVGFTPRIHHLHDWDDGVLTYLFRLTREADR